MNEPQWTDAALIAAIQEGKEARNLALQQLFSDQQLRRSIINHVMKHGGNEQDGEDVFQDAIILLDRNIREKRFEGKSSLRTYLFGIAKWRWVSLRRKYNGDVELEPRHQDGQEESPEVRLIAAERRTLINQVLEKMGDKCRDLLKYYRLSYSMQEIADLLSISSAQQAKRDAYRCRKRFREYVTADPQLMKLLNLT